MLSRHLIVALLTAAPSSLLSAVLLADDKPPAPTVSKAPASNAPGATPAAKQSSDKPAVDAKPSEPKPVASKPAEPTPPQAKPVPPKAAEPKPGDSKPAATVPTRPATSAAPATDKSAPAKGQPATAKGQPAATPGKPAETKPADAKETSIENAPPGPLAGHSSHGETFDAGPRQAAVLIEGTGKIQFPATSKHPNVQAFINQGVGQLHGFWYFEAERSFRMAAYHDPDCAIAYWGMALANVNNDKRLRGFLAEAVKRKDQASVRERLYIDALDELYKADKKTEADRRRQYVRRLEAIIHQFPEDIEAKALLALNIWQNNGKGVPLSSHEAVDSLAREVLAANPLHPVHHYRIHLWDGEKAQRALNSAAQCGPAAPGIAHMWHMPGHIYSNLQRYVDAVWQQEAASRTDHAYMMRFRVMPDEIHNYAHNHEWMIRNLSYLGEARKAVELAKNLIEMPRHPRWNMVGGGKKGSGSFGRTRLIELLNRYELWEDTLCLSDSGYLDPVDDVLEDAPRMRLLASAHFNLNNIELGKKLLAEAESRLAKLKTDRDEAGKKAETAANGRKEAKDKVTKAKQDAERPFLGKVQAAEQAFDFIKGLELLAAGDAKQALVHFEKSKTVQKEFLSRMHLAAGDKAKAEQVAREARDAGAKQMQPLANYVDILLRVGKTSEAQNAFGNLREQATNIDLDTPIAKRLAPLAAAAKLPADWRMKAEPAKDLGPHPALDSLGPIRWRPTLAPRFELPDADGKLVGLDEYRGRPVVLIFYLGFGCVHCVEQLKAFKPMTEEFTRAGISILSISTDDVPTVKKSLVNAGEYGKYPFPIVSDPAMNVFRSYRAYDDFESQPLHATLLLDADGLVRWQDISYEPFANAAFLLKESQRLLKLSGGKAGDQAEAKAACK